MNGSSTPNRSETHTAASVPDEGIAVYRVIIDVLATPEQASGLAVAMAKAADFNHVGAITVTPVEATNA